MWRYVAVVVLLVNGLVIGQERITLATPETSPSNVDYQLSDISLNRDRGEVTIQLRGQHQESVLCVYNTKTTPTGATLLKAMNKADFSTPYVGNATTGSLAQRVYHRLVVMSESATVCSKPLVGTLSGAVP